MALIREAVEDCAPPSSVVREDYLAPEAGRCRRAFECGVIRLMARTGRAHICAAMAGVQSRPEAAVRCVGRYPLLLRGTATAAHPRDFFADRDQHQAEMTFCRYSEGSKLARDAYEETEPETSARSLLWICCKR